MAVSVDDSVARASNDGGSSITTGSFDTVSGDGLVVCGNCDESNDSNNTTWTISDNQTPDLTYVTINERDGSDGDGGGVINYNVVSSGAITGLTVTLAVSGSVGSDSPSVKVYKVTGHDTADMVGAINEGSLTTDPQTTTAITSETAGHFFANWTDWNQTGAPTSSDLTSPALATFNTSGDVSGASGGKAIAAASSSVTGNMNSGGAPAGNWTVFEIRAAAAAGRTALNTRSNPLGVEVGMGWRMTG